MLRYALLLVFLIAFAGRGNAYNETANWADKKLDPALRDALVAASSWHRMPAAFAAFDPPPSLALTLRSACAANVNAAFYDELLQRGATMGSVKGCAKIIYWAAEDKTGLTYTLRELQKKYLPLKDAAEASAFFYAAGLAHGLPVYATVQKGVIYMMTAQSFCGGLGNKRLVYRMDASGNALIFGMVTEPPPTGAGCHN